MMGCNGSDVYEAYAGIDRQSETAAHGWDIWTDQVGWLGVQEEVKSEVRAEIVLLGLGNVGKSTLFNTLHGWPVTVTGLKLGQQPERVEERMGLFTLVDLPEGEEVHEDYLLERLGRAALLIYLLDGSVGRTQRGVDEAVIRPEDSRWIGRLRATGCPLMVVLNKADLWGGQLRAILASVERRLGLEVVAISAQDPLEVQWGLLDRMVEVCPRLAVPLGREVAMFRRAAAMRLTRRAALLCGLVAMQPFPLVDLPMQVGTQVGLVARICTMYGHPPSSDYSRELLLTGAGSTAVRLLATQIARLVPVLGWAVSGMLGATTTWLLGQSSVAYFEGWAPPRTRWDGLREGGIDRVLSWFRQRLAFAQCVRIWSAALGRGAVSRKWQSKRATGPRRPTPVYARETEE